jgi:hypothetical protein
MPSEMWRSAAQYLNTLFFASLKGVYAINGTEIINISKQRYYYKIYDTFLARMSGDYTEHITAIYDEAHDDYYLQLTANIDFGFFTVPITYVLVYNVASKHWMGRFTYQYDKYISLDNKTYGIGNRYPYYLNKALSFQLHQPGYKIGNEIITGKVFQQHSPSQGYPAESISSDAGKEFIKIRITSNVAPTSIKFFDPDNEIIAPILGEDGLLAEIVGTDLDNYDGFEQYVPKIKADVDPDRNRIQGRTVIYEIIHSEEGEFKITESAVMFKELK